MNQTFHCVCVYPTQYHTCIEKIIYHPNFKPNKCSEVIINHYINKRKRNNSKIFGTKEHLYDTTMSKNSNIVCSFVQLYIRTIVIHLSNMGIAKTCSIIQ